MRDEATHKRLIMEQFALQAIPFSEIPGHSQSLRMLVEMAGASKTGEVLDVACGPGIVACEFACHCGHVTGIDVTPQMIAQARERQKSRRLKNLTWQVGDVMTLPFPDSRFDVVLTRYSFHHFLAPGRILAEMARVCRKGGRVVVADVVLPVDKTAVYDELETLRDPSHVHALSFEEMASVWESAPLANMRTAMYKVDLEVEEQLRASFPNPGDVEKIRAIFKDDIGVDRLGINAHWQDGTIHYSVPVMIVTGEKNIAFVGPNVGT